MNKQNPLQYLTKPYQETSVEEWPDLPVSSIRGISDSDEKLLKESFNVTTIGKFANLKFFKWAEEIIERADSDSKSLDGFEDKLIKKYEGKTPKSVARAPIFALQGVSEDDAKRLQEAFNIKTVRSFSRLKYYQYAKEIYEESKTHQLQISKTEEMKSASQPEQEGDKPSSNRWIFLTGMIIFIILLIIGYYIWQPAFKVKKPVALNLQEKANTIQKEEPEAPKKSEKPELKKDNTYIIEYGDTLARISFKKFGNYSHTKELYEINKETLTSMNKIYPGQKIYLTK